MVKKKHHEFLVPVESEFGEAVCGLLQLSFIISYVSIGKDVYETGPGSARIP